MLKTNRDTPEEELIFNSAGECDRYFNLWRGATSFYVNRDGKIGNNKAFYL